MYFSSILLEGARTFYYTLYILSYRTPVRQNTLLVQMK